MDYIEALLQRWRIEMETLYEDCYQYESGHPDGERKRGMFDMLNRCAFDLEQAQGCQQRSDELDKQKLPLVEFEFDDRSLVSIEKLRQMGIEFVEVGTVTNGYLLIPKPGQL